MSTVVIGIDPHKASHTAVAVDERELPLGDLRVRASAAQTERLTTPARSRSLRCVPAVCGPLPQTTTLP